MAATWSGLEGCDPKHVVKDDAGVAYEGCISAAPNTASAVVGDDTIECFWTTP